MKIRLMCLLLGMFLQALPVVAVPLIVNGDFEATGTGLLPVTGWDPVAGGSLINGATPSNTGTKILVLTPGAAAQQTGIATTTGQLYLLEFFYLSALGTPTASWNGGGLGAPLRTFVSTTNALYTGNDYLVVGGAGPGTLRFNNPSGANAGIDTVSLVAVPELDSKGGGTALAFLGLLVLLLHDRRRRVAQTAATE